MGNMRARLAARTIKADYLPPKERNDRWLTPLNIIADLGSFDLDPCGAPGHRTAERVYLLECGDDGLRDPWWGRVWMNPPYGDANLKLWLERMLRHIDDGGTATALLPVATGTKNWMDRIWPNATAIHFWRHRINFLRRDGQNDQRMVSPTASAIVAFGDIDADAILKTEWPGMTIDFRVGKSS